MAENPTNETCRPSAQDVLQACPVSRRSFDRRQATGSLWIAGKSLVEGLAVRGSAYGETISNFHPKEGSSMREMQKKGGWRQVCRRAQDLLIFKFTADPVRGQRVFSTVFIWTHRAFRKIKMLRIACCMSRQAGRTFSRVFLLFDRRNRAAPSSFPTISILIV